MPPITYITPDFAVTAALQAQDFERIVALGFRAVINNLPDGEDASLPTGADCGRQALEHGLAYRHIPADMHDLFTDGIVAAMADALARENGPVLAHCRTGIRSAIIWAAASARTQSVEVVLGALAAAGFDLGFLRDELDSQADRRRWAAA